jgi:hypothetical protein
MVCPKGQYDEHADDGRRFWLSALFHASPGPCHREECAAGTDTEMSEALIIDGDSKLPTSRSRSDWNTTPGLSYPPEAECYKR